MMLLGPSEQSDILRAFGIDPTDVVSWELRGGFDRIVDAEVVFRVREADDTILRRYRLVEVPDEEQT